MEDSSKVTSIPFVITSGVIVEVETDEANPPVVLSSGDTTVYVTGTVTVVQLSKEKFLSMLNASVMSKPNNDSGMGICAP